MKNSVKVSIWTGVIALAVMLAVGGYLVLHKSVAKPRHKVVFALPALPHSSLVHVALAKGYFMTEGVDVTVQEHVFGKTALASVTDGKADLAAVGDTPIMMAVLKGSRINILAELLQSGKDNVLIARKDLGISIPQDLNGKRIGVTIGTTGDFFLESFLTLHRIAKKDIEIINVKPDEIVNALVTGKIDAASIWYPIVFQLQKELGERSVSFHGETIFTATFDVVAMEDYARQNPDVIRSIIKALLRAEEFVKAHPSESIKLVSTAIRTDEMLLSQYWNIYTFRVSLGQSLIINLEDQARWAIKAKLTEATKVPNFVSFFYIDGLKSVKPEAVSIIQ